VLYMNECFSYLQEIKAKTLEEEFGTLIFTVGTSQKFNHFKGIEYVREIS
jgi:hypothetical protein